MIFFLVTLESEPVLRIMADGSAIEALHDRVAQLENFLGGPQSNDAISVVVQLDWVNNKVGELTQTLYEYMTETEWKHVKIMADMGTLIDTLKVRVQMLEDEVAVVRSATHSLSTSVEMVP